MSVFHSYYYLLYSSGYDYNIITLFSNDIYHVHNEVDGREFKKIIKNVALEDIGL